MMRKTKMVAVAALAALGSASAANAATITVWNFEGIATTPAASGIPASTGTGSAGTNTGGTLSSPAGNGSTDSYSSNGWNSGEYFEFTTGVTGFQDITVTFDQTRSSTGPDDFTFQYSTNGTTFTSAGAYVVAQNTWSSGTPVASSYTFDLSAVSALDNDSSIFFRLVTSDSPAAGGTNRVDNFVVSGTAISTGAVPEPTSLGLLGAAGLMALRRRRHA